jgi:hypothetical protein
VTSRWTARPGGQSDLHFRAAAETADKPASGR